VIQAAEGMLPSSWASARAWPDSDCAASSVVLEVSDESLVVSNVDLTQARIGGLGTDVARRFLERFAEGAGVTLHVRLLNGTETQHVLEAIFKALGVALAQACGTEGGESGR